MNHHLPNDIFFQFSIFLTKLNRLSINYLQKNRLLLPLLFLQEKLNKCLAINYKFDIPNL